MSPRIAYWTSAFEPEMEAIASEVATLRRHFPGSIAWGLHPGHWARLSWRRGFRLHPRLHLLFRGATRLLERAFQINHVFGSLGDWFYLEGPRCRPTVLTLAAFQPPVARQLLDRVDRFVAESPAALGQLEELGIARERIRLIFPPVDLGRFAPTSSPAGPFTVLFASSPDSAEWLEGRGVPLILEAAALRPAMRFRLLWRPWGDSLPRVRGWIEERGLANVELRPGRVADMAAEYQAAHATVAPFRRADRCKPAPNSLVESLACGRPVAVTPLVGLADLILAGDAGVVCDETGGGLAEGLDRLQAGWMGYAARSRSLAEAHFGTDRFLEGYRALYRELL